MINTDKTGIAIFVYKRHQHISEVLEGFRKNSIEKLYIFADGPKLTNELEAMNRCIG
ncbi:MAG: hypothetical protein KAS66_09940 [Candidatus Omnitrophica bacterium]|nr:hypothetical protein [Candidatus Omnitrophota bacterium]